MGQPNLKPEQTTKKDTKNKQSDSDDVPRAWACKPQTVLARLRVSDSDHVRPIGRGPTVTADGRAATTFKLSAVAALVNADMGQLRCSIAAEFALVWPLTRVSALVGDNLHAAAKSQLLLQHHGAATFCSRRRRQLENSGRT
jgi:hypothetical protein